MFYKISNECAVFVILKHVPFTSLVKCSQNFLISVNFPFQFKMKTLMIIDEPNKQWTGDFRASVNINSPLLSFPEDPL